VTALLYHYKIGAINALIN